MIITVRVSTKSRKSELVRETDDTFKARVTSAPERGKANEELLRLLAAHFRVRKSDIIILRGERGREKLIEIPIPHSPGANVSG